FIRPLDERDIERVFELGFANDSRQAVGGTEIVGRMKSVQAEDAKAAFREMISCGTAHRAEANDDDFVLEGHLCLTGGNRGNREETLLSLFAPVQNSLITAY